MQRETGTQKPAAGSRAIRYALIGSLLGTIAMDLVMVIESVILGMPVDGFWAMIGSVVRGGVLVGVVIHYLTGTLIGLLFGLAVQKVPMLKVDSVWKGTWLGLLLGLVTIPLGCVPFAIITGVSIVKMVSFSFIPHLVWGTVTGLVAGYKLGSRSRSAQVSAAR